MISEFISSNDIHVYIKPVRNQMHCEGNRSASQYRRYGCFFSKHTKRIIVYLSLSGSERPTLERIMKILAIDMYLAQRISRSALPLVDSNRKMERDTSSPRQNESPKAVVRHQARAKRADKIKKFLGEEAYDELLEIGAAHLEEEGLLCAEG